MYVSLVSIFMQGGVLWCYGVIPASVYICGECAHVCVCVCVCVCACLGVCLGVYVCARRYRVVAYPKICME